MSEFEKASEMQGVSALVEKERLETMSLAEILDTYDKVGTSSQSKKQYLVDRHGVILL